MGARLIAVEDEPTTKVWTSAVIRGLKRPLDPSSDVESRERIRCAILTALESAASSSERARGALRPLTPAASRVVETSSILAPLRPRPNPFLQAPRPEDPPAPWLLLRRARIAHRRRSNLPIATIVLALAIGLGLIVDKGVKAGRVAIVHGASGLVSAHAAKVVVPHHPIRVLR